MKKLRSFDPLFTNLDALPAPAPDFSNVLKILNKEKPDRLTLFEFIVSQKILLTAVGADKWPEDEESWHRTLFNAFANLGYDYAVVQASNYRFPRADAYAKKESISLNDGATIYDWDSFEKYPWMDPVACYDGLLERAEKWLPKGMKMIISAPMGILENVISLTGYENLCYMLADDPDLAEAIFNKIGTGILEYYRTIIHCNGVGAIIYNDDWGFNQQTMLSTEDMRKYVFPWHKKVVELAHEAGKPVILHSCGNLSQVIDDIAFDIGYDAKHSYEDKIMPVEQAYDAYHQKFAVLGGIDIDFMARRTPKEIYDRAVTLLKKTDCKAYGLGTGNSVPDYIPLENYTALLSAVLHNR